MLKRTITFEDFDENPAVETLYFNITKTEIGEHLDLVESFEDLKKMFEGEKRELSTKEVERILKFVKTLMRLSYGIRSEDGKSFAKSDEIWTKFTQTAAYDAFTFSLFENPNEANDFMIGIFPKDLIAAAQTQMNATEIVELPQPKLDIAPSPDPTLGKKSKDPKDMSREELIEAMREKIAENNKQ
jgi:hypothetical protein